MQASDFIRKWGPQGTAHELNERAGAQAHFIDLCRVLGMPEPADPENYCFERGLTKTGSAGGRTDGFADVWLRGHFAWEYKAPGKSLEGALKQLMMYALPLENPPLLVVSDRLRIEIHTHFTGTPSEKHVFALDEMGRPEVQQRLRALWTDPEAFRPRRSNRDITEEAARTFAGTAERLREAGVPVKWVWISMRRRSLTTSSGGFSSGSAYIISCLSAPSRLLPGALYSQAKWPRSQTSAKPSVRSRPCTARLPVLVTPRSKQ